MIVGVGLDLADVGKIGRLVRGQAFRHKVFTPAEIAQCQAGGRAAEHYAGKFAAKEALMKAVRRGIRQGVWFSQIEVLTSEQGAPCIHLSGEAAEAARALGAAAIHVSITHTGELAAAVVILESADQAPAVR